VVDVSDEQPGEGERFDAAQRWARTIDARSTRAHGRRTLVRLLDAAVTEFAEYGWHQARMARIAKRAGTAHGTVYAYFLDKDDLLLALHQEMASDFRETFVAMPPLQPGAEGFVALQDWLAEVCASFQRNGAIAYAVSEVLTDEEHSAAGREALRDQRRMLSVVADRVRASGSTGLDPVIAALCIFALVEGANLAVHRGELLVSERELVDGLAEFVHRSVFGVRVGSRAGWS
jgi:AcrR family transcriptional regulator